MAVTKLSPEKFAALSKTSRAVPSPYENDVREAAPGEAYAIDLSKELPARKVVNNLHKAAKAVGKKIQVRVRENAKPPVVIFQVVAVPTAAE